MSIPVDNDGPAEPGGITQGEARCAALVVALDHIAGEPCACVTDSGPDDYTCPRCIAKDALETADEAGERLLSALGDALEARAFEADVVAITACLLASLPDEAWSQAWSVAFEDDCDLTRSQAVGGLTRVLRAMGAPDPGGITVWVLADIAKRLTRGSAVFHRPPTDEYVPMRLVPAFDPRRVPDEGPCDRHPPGVTCMACDPETARLVPMEGEESGTGWGPIASIIADGYDTGEDSEAIGRAVHAYVTRGEPNPFEEDANLLHSVDPPAPTDTENE